MSMKAERTGRRPKAVQDRARAAVSALLNRRVFVDDAPLISQADLAAVLGVNPGTISRRVAARALRSSVGNVSSQLFTIGDVARFLGVESNQET